MFLSIPYRPFAIRMVLRSLVIWIGIRAFVTGLAGSVVLEWQAAFTVALLCGGLAYGDTVRRREPLFLSNCGVPRTSVILLTFGAAVLWEVALYGGYTTWIMF